MGYWMLILLASGVHLVTQLLIQIGNESWYINSGGKMYFSESVYLVVAERSPLGRFPVPPSQDGGIVPGPCYLS